eukprot:gnl/TRDRNA2_/TRDRNA2_167801_c0_seq4.p1 gnl/TRDRNA2_/TRDRNA2_167801_c0~~gnl/TRDRNA2_/TRDRNA2_167801_c0_seq4.p1  ORF type:complete len:397 (+),score=52.57 gnl/TRDRNA2_/TRDRNA2_167801_c0_seq4:104-1294(+)
MIALAEKLIQAHVPALVYNRRRCTCGLVCLWASIFLCLRTRLHFGSKPNTLLAGFNFRAATRHPQFPDSFISSSVFSPFRHWAKTSDDRSFFYSQRPLTINRHLQHEVGHPEISLRSAQAAGDAGSEGGYAGMFAAGRRVVLGALASSLTMSRCAAGAVSQVSKPLGVAVIATGFLVPPEQYVSYSNLLRELGLLPIIFNDGSSLFSATNITTAARKLLAAADEALDGPDVPLFLIGHSRGAAVSLAAAGMSTRRVAAMVLMDPVGRSLLSQEALALPQKIPTAILGSGAGAGECAPPGDNYAAFYEELESKSTSRVLAFLGDAGHMQYVDKRMELADPCTVGSVKDDAVREAAMAVLTAWCVSFVPGVEARVKARDPEGSADELPRHSGRSWYSA